MVSPSLMKAESTAAVMMYLLKIERMKKRERMQIDHENFRKAWRIGVLVCNNRTMSASSGSSTQQNHSAIVRPYKKCNKRNRPSSHDKQRCANLAPRLSP